eukprot:3076909-Rhodomonas_salina.1
MLLEVRGEEEAWVEAKKTDITLRLSLFKAPLQTATDVDNFDLDACVTQHVTVVVDQVLCPLVRSDVR